MAKQYSSFQKKVIKNYYDNLDTIALQKLQELISDMYLCESDKKWAQMWKKADSLLEKLPGEASVKKKVTADQDLGELAKLVSSLI